MSNPICRVLLLTVALSLPDLRAAEVRKPNVVLIYADDIGYGDFGCYGGKVPTPHVDGLAREGLRFTQAYASSASCTPSRYSLLTGEYAFRQPGTSILRGDAALIIQPGRATLASTLRDAGYITAAIGKWHLGLGDGRAMINWNAPIGPGPSEIGFAESFIMPATGDRVPCVYLRDGRVVGLDPSDPIEVNYDQPFPGEPDGVTHRDSLRMDWSFGHNQAVVNGVGRIGYMKGGRTARWNDEDMADTFTREAAGFIVRHAGHPFFLYFATHDVHVPRLPHRRFQGVSGLGPRGDALVQFDSCVGVILAALEKHGLRDNTLVIVTSDNGPVLDDGYQDGANAQLGQHRPAAGLRGGKYSLFEAGTRVPFIVRWPGRIAPSVSDAILSQVDLPATLARLAGTRFDATRGPDSRDLLDALLGDYTQGRTSVLLHAGKVALREGNWLYVPPATTREGMNRGTETAVGAPGALFDLATDPGQRHDLSAVHPARLAQMRDRLAAQVGSPPAPGAGKHSRQ